VPKTRIALAAFAPAVISDLSVSFLRTHGVTSVGAVGLRHSGDAQRLCG